MLDQEQILEVIYDAIDGLNRSDFAGRELAKSPDTVLMGRASTLDSIDLVTVVVETEEKLAAVVGAEVPLADEKAVSEKNSPYRTVATFAEFIRQALEQHGHA